MFESIIIYTALAVGAIIILTILMSSFYLVQQAEVIIIERLGKFHRLLTPGLHFVIPIFDKPRNVYWSHVRAVDEDRYYRYSKTIERIDLREAVYDFPKQSVITKDNVTTEISAIVYYHIVDPRAAVYEVLDLPQAIEKLAQTMLRAVIGSMDLDETLVSRDQINTKLRITLDEAALKWGVNVTRVELQDVDPPEDIKLAMEKQMRAERERRAVILEAEGSKQSAILRAEGELEARVLNARGTAEAKVINAQGEADARLKVANAEAQALALTAKALPNADAVAYLIALQYLKTLPMMTEGKDNKLVVIPYEATGALGSLAAIKELFVEKSVSKK